MARIEAVRRSKVPTNQEPATLGIPRIMKPYEITLREQVMKAIDEGMPLRAAARRFNVDPSTVSRWRQRRESTGFVLARPKGRRRALLGGWDEWLADFMLGQPDATAMDVHVALRRGGPKVSYATVRRFMIKQGYAKAAVRPGKRP